MTDSILIIESEPSLSKELTSALTEAGFVVADVPNYSEALLKLDEFKPNMVIMDKESAGIEGWTACSELRQAHDVAIILMGKDSSGEAWMRAVEAGADFYLKKPFSYLVLVARVKAILRRYGRSTRGNGLRIETNIFELFNGRYRSLSELAKVMRISVSCPAPIKDTTL